MSRYSTPLAGHTLLTSMKATFGIFRLASRIRKATAIFKKQYEGDPQGRWADDALFGLGNCAEALHGYDEAIKKYKLVHALLPADEELEGVGESFKAISEKLASRSLGRLMAGVTHEVRNPLNAMTTPTSTPTVIDPSSINARALNRICLLSRA